MYEKYTAVREIKTMQNEKLKVPWTGLKYMDLANKQISSNSTYNSFTTLNGRTVRNKHTNNGIRKHVQ